MCANRISRKPIANCGEGKDRDENSASVYWLVHPVRAVLAAGAARIDSLSGRVAAVSAAAARRDSVSALFSFVRTVLFLPARLLGWRKSSRAAT